MSVVTHERIRCPRCSAVMEDKGSMDVPRMVCPNCGYDTASGPIQ